MSDPEGERVEDSDGQPSKRGRRRAWIVLAIALQSPGSYERATDAVRSSVRGVRERFSHTDFEVYRQRHRLHVSRRRLGERRPDAVHGALDVILACHVGGDGRVLGKSLDERKQRWPIGLTHRTWDHDAGLPDKFVEHEINQ